MDLGCKRQDNMVTKGSDNALSSSSGDQSGHTRTDYSLCYVSDTARTEFCLHCSAIRREMILVRLPRVTWMAINMLPKHGGDASCGQAGDATKCNIIPLSMVDWYLIRLTIASNSGEHVKSDGGGRYGNA